MYEKNCLTYSCLKHIEQSPYTIVLQMHPSTSQEKKEFMQKLYEIEPNVKLQHIRAHTGLTDELSLGNEGADRMANEAIGLKSCPHADKNLKQKYYLKIPYSEKEVGKKYGAKWDPKKKKWYYEGLNKDTNFLKLIELFPL